MNHIGCIKFTYPLLLASFLLINNHAAAQKEIVISEGLASNGEKLPVRMGTQWMGKIWNIRFGEYAVVSSKMGWLTYSSKSNAFNTRTETTSAQKFSFVLANKASDSARVNAGNDVMEEWKTIIETNVDLGITNILDVLLSQGPFSGYVEGVAFVTLARKVKLSESDNFNAFITVNGDTTDTWSLSMIITRDRQSPGNYEGFLTNGEHEILIVKVNSKMNGKDSRTLPALGYEFIENGQSLSALQYNGGGAFGMNKNIVWINNENDVKMKLVLSAAMTAVLQISWNKLE
jgi:hypothetical protein